MIKRALADRSCFALFAVDIKSPQSSFRWSKIIQLAGIKSKVELFISIQKHDLYIKHISTRIISVVFLIQITKLLTTILIVPLLHFATGLLW